MLEIVKRPVNANPYPELSRDAGTGTRGCARVDRRSKQCACVHARVHQRIGESRAELLCRAAHDVEDEMMLKREIL